MTGIRVLRRLSTLATTLFPVALILFVSYTSAQTSDDPLALIASALQNKQFKEALDLLGSAIQKSPQNAQLWAMQGTAYAGQGHKKEALTSFRNASKIAPNYVPALQGEVQIEYEAGSAAAIPVLRHLLRLKPDDRTSHGMLAVLEYQQGNCNEAAIHFEKAGNLFDAQVEGLHAYAVCLVKIRQFDRAATVFQRSLTLEPDDKREHQLLASIQLMAKQPQAAIATLAPLLRSDPPDVESLELASAAYEDAHDTEHAVDVLRQAILLAPNNVNLYSDFANLSSLHQSFQVGLNVVNDGLALQPKAAPLYFARGILYVQLGEYDKGQADFETAYELDPNQSLSTAALGLAAMQQNNLDQALASVQAKLVRTPNDPILLYLQADVLTQKGAELGSPEFESAMRSAKKAVELRPALGPARSVLAKLYLQSGHYPEAAAQCRRALEIDPKDQVALYHLIQALRKSGSKTEIPDLLKRLALARQDATREERELYRYRLVEGDAPTK